MEAVVIRASLVSEFLGHDRLELTMGVWFTIGNIG